MKDQKEGQIHFPRSIADHLLFNGIGQVTMQIIWQSFVKFEKKVLCLMTII